MWQVAISSLSIISDDFDLKTAQSVVHFLYRYIFIVVIGQFVGQSSRCVIQAAWNSLCAMSRAISGQTRNRRRRKDLE